MEVNMAIYLPFNLSQPKRFVFYSSLRTYPNEASNVKGYTSEDAYDKAIERLYSIRDDISKEDGEDSAYKSALNLLERMYLNELEKEKRLLSSKINDKTLPQNIKNILIKACNPENFNYEAFIRAMNSYYLRIEDLNAKIDSSLEDMKIVSDAVDAAYSRYRNFTTGNAKEKMKRVKLKDGTPKTTQFYLFGNKEGKKGRISKERTDKVSKALDNLRENQFTLADLDRKKYIELSNKIVKVINEEHKKDVYEILNGSSNAKNKMIKILDYLTYSFFQDYMNRENNKSRQANGFENYKTKNFSDFFSDDKNESEFVKAISNAYTFFSNNLELIEKTSEELFGKDNTISYNEFQRKRKRIMDEAEKLSNEIGSGARGTKFLIGSKKDENHKQDTRKFSTAAYWDDTRTFTGDKKKQKNYNRLLELRQEYKDLSELTKIKSSGSLSVEAEKLQTIQSGLQTNVLAAIKKGQYPGKDDTLTFHLVYTPPEIVVENDAINNMNDAVDSAISKIVKISKDGSMSKQELEKRFNEQRKIYKELSDAFKETKKKAKLAKESLNIFVEHGSTKEYTFLDNSIGFRGGNLGVGNRIDSALENIALMAEKGGISLYDQRWLTFAAINCARHLIGAELNMQSTLENYLSLLAGALMFEDADLIMEEVNKKFVAKTNNTIEHIHIYRLEGFFFPLSYILYKTWEDLKVLDNYLQSAEHSGNQVHIRNSYPWKKFDKVTEQEWIKEGNEAFEKTTITMTFMAGFLDVLEKLKITTI